MSVNRSQERRGTWRAFHVGLWLTKGNRHEWLGGLRRLQVFNGTRLRSPRQWNILGFPSVISRRPGLTVFLKKSYPRRTRSMLSDFLGPILETLWVRTESITLIRNLNNDSNKIKERYDRGIKIKPVLNFQVPNLLTDSQFMYLWKFHQVRWTDIILW